MHVILKHKKRLKYRHCSEIVNQRLNKYRLPIYTTRKQTSVERHHKKLWYLDRVICEYKKRLEKKDITVKSSTYRNTLCQFTKQERDQVLKTLQWIVVSEQIFLWMWEMAEKEKKKELEIFPIFILCGFKRWFISQLLKLIQLISIDNSAFEFFRTFRHFFVDWFDEKSLNSHSYTVSKMSNLTN